MKLIKQNQRVDASVLLKKGNKIFIGWNMESKIGEETERIAIRACSTCG